MGDKVPIVCLIGNLGAGKTSWEVSEVRRLSVHSPVISSVPVVLPRRSRLFLAFDPGDVVAAAFTFSQWVFSKEAREIAKTQKKLKRWLAKPGAMLTDEEIDQRFDKMQDEYVQVAQRIDWRDKLSFNALIQAHDERVIANRLDAPLEGLFDEAEAFKRRDMRTMARGVHGDFRFKYTPPAFPWCVFADEGGVFSSADDHSAIKESAFLPMLAQMRKLGGRYMTSTHDPSRLLKQLREIVTLWIKVYSFDVPGLAGRIYITMGFQSEDAFEGGRRIRSFDVRFISYDTMSCYPTYWIVPQPDYGDLGKEGRPGRRRSAPVPAAAEQKPKLELEQMTVAIDQRAAGRAGWALEWPGE